MGIDTRLTLLVAVFVELSGWPTWVNLTASMVVVAFFVIAIVTYIGHGSKRDTTNQFERPARGVHAGILALIVAEIGGFTVLLTGFVAAQLL